MKTPRMFPLGLLLLAASTAPVWAGDTPRASSTRHSAWKVQGEKCAVYLLGSVHVLKAENYPLPTVFETAFSNSSIVVFETDIGAMQKPEAQMKLLSQAALPGGQTLKDVLSEKTYTDLQHYLDESGVPAFLINSMKPGMAVMMLSMLELQREGYSAEQGMDLYFYNRAKKQQKIIRGLEGLDFQINLISNLSKEEGESLIKSTLKDLKQAGSKFGSLLKAWQTGDSASLETLLNDAQKEDPALLKKLLTDRNQKWVPQIEALAKGTNNAVVIVGAGHLVGKGGVVDLLRHDGCNVVQE